MQYLLLIYNQENEWGAMPAAVQTEMMAKFGAFTKSIQDSGHFKKGERLYNTDKATSVRVRDGKTIITDGPFAETKEQLGGFYLIEAPDLDVATEIASRIPSAVAGTIEVRPIMPMEPR
jgi:hypothetical protein